MLSFMGVFALSLLLIFQSSVCGLLQGGLKVPGSEEIETGTEQCELADYEQGPAERFCAGGGH